MTTTPPLPGTRPQARTDGSTLAGRVARRWVRVYTARLSHEARDRRRAEIESDVWEHLADARSQGRRTSSTQLDLLARVLVGIPADVAWFTQERRYEKDGTMQMLPRSTERAVGPVVAVVAVLALAVVAVMFGGWARSVSLLTLIPLGLLIFVGTRSAVARQPAPAGPSTASGAQETPFLHTRRRLRIVLAVSGAIFALTVAAWIVLISTGDDIGVGALIGVTLPGTLALFVVLGTALLLEINSLGLQRLRIDSAPSIEAHQSLRHRSSVTVVLAGCAFGLVLAAWGVMLSTPGNLGAGFGPLINLIGVVSVFVAAGHIWLLAVTRHDGRAVGLSPT